MRKSMLLASIAIGVSLVNSAQAAPVPTAKSGQNSQEVLINASAVDTVEAALAGGSETVEGATKRRTREMAASTGTTTTTKNLYYGGGGIATTAPKIYLVLWGSQWNNNDPSNEVGILKNFFYGISGSPWLMSVTQYCQGIKTGSYTCNGTTGPRASANTLFAESNVWFDNAAAAPAAPTQSQMAAEALRAAAKFGNKTAASNANAMYIIATAHGYNSSGFVTSWCAYHSYVSSSTYGKVAYTNLPYQTDGGVSCGAGFNGLSPTAGITIVAGHEVAETITDMFPSTGWKDSAGAENADKCGWIKTGIQGAIANVQFSNGIYPVQSLWSNAFNNGLGGCVMSY